MEVVTDFDGDTVADVVQLDLDGDGVPDVTYIDSDRDGRLDTVLRTRGPLTAQSCACQRPDDSELPQHLCSGQVRDDSTRVTRQLSTVRAFSAA